MDIFEASKTGNLNRVNELLNLGININIQDEQGYTPLMYACIKQQSNIVTRLINNVPPADVNLENNDGQTALILACIEDNLEIINTLLQVQNIDVNHNDSLNGETALISACEYGNIDIVEALLKVPGIDINKSSNHNFSPLMYSVIENKYSITKILYNLPGLNINAIDIYGNTALIYACEYKRMSSINLLLTVPDINVTHENNYGQTAMYWMIFHHNMNIDIIQNLVDHGAPKPVLSGLITSPVPVSAPEILPEVEENNPFAHRLLCNVCMVNAVNTRLNPCGHLLCSVCYTGLPLPKKCPTCRTTPITNEAIFYGGFFNKYNKYKNKLSTI